MNFDFKRYLTIQNVDKFLFVILTVFIFVLIINNAVANVHFDDADHVLMLNAFRNSIDYTFFNQLNGSNIEDLVKANRIFPEYRFPGYSIMGVFPSYFLSFLDIAFNFPHNNEDNICNNIGSWDDIMLTELLSKIISGENEFNINCNFLISLFLVSYISLIVGIYFCAKLLFLLKEKYTFLSIIPILILSLPIFLHNILITPLYHTAFSFGLISIFSYFFIKEMNKKIKDVNLFIPGLILGFIAITRIEGILLFIAIVIFCKYKKLGVNLVLFIKGFFPAITVFLFYNFLILKNPLEFGFLNNSFNYFALNFKYIFDTTINPVSGLLFYSTLLILGIFILYKHPNKNIKFFFIFSLLIIFSLLFRLSVLNNCSVGEKVLVDSIWYNCFGSTEELTRFDNNRYILILFPFSIIGLNYLLNLGLKRIKDKKG